MNIVRYEKLNTKSMKNIVVNLKKTSLKTNTIIEILYAKLNMV